MHHLEIHLDPNFASHISNNRNSIRQSIVDRYQAQTTESERLAILDLNQRPASQKLHFSVSHMKHNGGYAVSSEKIGFDVEDISRISTEVIHRISTPAEIAICPQIEFLWSAKEAAFKAVGETQSLVFTDIKITAWSKFDDIDFFKAQITDKTDYKFEGAIFKISENIMVALVKLDRAQS
jgi:phosphopantetheinyl transferase (holo-ACP synthase)